MIEAMAAEGAPAGLPADAVTRNRVKLQAAGLGGVDPARPWDPGAAGKATEAGFRIIRLRPADLSLWTFQVHRAAGVCGWFPMLRLKDPMKYSEISERLKQQPRVLEA